MPAGLFVLLYVLCKLEGLAGRVEKHLCYKLGKVSELGQRERKGGSKGSREEMACEENPKAMWHNLVAINISKEKTDWKLDVLVGYGER